MSFGVIIVLVWWRCESKTLLIETRARARVLPASRWAWASVLCLRWRSAVAGGWPQREDMHDGVVNKVSEWVSAELKGDSSGSKVRDAWWQDWQFLHHYPSLDLTVLYRNLFWEVKSSIFWDITPFSPMTFRRNMLLQSRDTVLYNFRWETYILKFWKCFENSTKPTYLTSQAFTLWRFILYSSGM
jgi:hypothetical protein